MRYPVWLRREAAVTWHHAGRLARHGLAHVAMQRRGMVGCRACGMAAFRSSCRLSRRLTSRRAPDTVHFRSFPTGLGMPQARDVGTSAFTDHQSSAPWRQRARPTDRGERVEVVVTVR
jgi:hypothetical protein